MEDRFKGLIVLALFAVIFGLNGLISCSGSEKKKEETPEKVEDTTVVSGIESLNEMFDSEIETTDTLDLESDSI